MRAMRFVFGNSCSAISISPVMLSPPMTPVTNARAGDRSRRSASRRVIPAAMIGTPGNKVG